MSRDQPEIKKLFIFSMKALRKCLELEGRISIALDRQTSIAVDSGCSPETIESLGRCKLEIQENIKQMAHVSRCMGEQVHHFSEEREPKTTIDEWCDLAYDDTNEVDENTAPQLSSASPELSTMTENQQNDNNKNSAEHTSNENAVQQRGQIDNIEPQLSSTSLAMPTMSKNEQHDKEEKRKRTKRTNRSTQPKNSIAAAKRRKQQQRDNTDKVLVHGHKIAEEVSVELSSYSLAVRSFSLETFAISNLVRAFDPREAQLQLVRSTARDLLLLIQNNFIFKSKLRSFEATLLQKQNNSAKERMDFAPTLTVGTILCSIAACEEEETNNESDQNSAIEFDLNALKEAMKRSKIGCRSWLNDSSNEITSWDISVMKDAFNLHQSFRNLLFHCLHLLVILDVEENMTMHKLLECHSDREALDATTALWDAINPGKTFDPESITMKTYREKVIFPARLMDSHRYNALKIAGIMSNKLTSVIGQERRNEISLLFDKALNKTIDGKKSESSEDYCGGKSDNHTRRRRRMTCLLHVMSCCEVIEHHMQTNISFGQFISSTLLQSSDFVRQCFGFLSGCNDKEISLRDKFFDSENDNDESTEIGKKLSHMAKIWKKPKQQKEQVVIIDTKSMKYFERLLRCDDSST